MAVACSIGLHWAFLQVVAWTGMVASYSRAMPVSEALVKTFDGKHPCSLCRHIGEGKRTEKKSDCGIELRKLEFAYAPVAFIFQPPSDFWEVRAGTMDAVLFTRPPPVPPPRPLPV